MGDYYADLLVTQNLKVANQISFCFTSDEKRFSDKKVSTEEFDIVIHLSKYLPTLILWLPLIYMHALKVETDIDRTIGYNIRALIVILLLYFLFRKMGGASWWREQNPNQQHFQSICVCVCVCLSVCLSVHFCGTA